MNEEELEPTEQPNQPEQPTPPLLTAAAPLDPAPLNALAETVAAKADAAALEPIHAALAALGGVPEGAHNLLVQYGSYKGAGTYGANNPQSLTFPFYPVAVFISSTAGYGPVVCMLRGCIRASYITDTVSNPMSLSWSSNGVSWYAVSNTTHMCNEGGASYTYCALGYAPTAA